MEASYVKSTVGPILAEALTSLVLHVPKDAHTSSYSTSIDPISYIGSYLLNHSESVKYQAKLDKELDTQESLIREFKESQAKQIKQREIVADGIIHRISTLKRVSQVTKDSAESPSVSAPAKIKEETTGESISSPAEQSRSEEAPTNQESA